MKTHMLKCICLILLFVLAVIVYSTFVAQQISPVDKELLRFHRCGPYISNVLAICDPRDYQHPVFDHMRPGKPYYLSSSESEQSLEILRSILKHTDIITLDYYDIYAKIERVSLEIEDDQELKNQMSKTLEITDKPRIIPLVISGDGPNLVFTLFPSMIKINIYGLYIENDNPRADITQGDGYQRFQGIGGNSFVNICLTCPLKNGETVISAINLMRSNSE